MEPRPSHTFDGFRLEPPPGGLWRGDVRLALRPRPLAMLRYLVAHAGRLVTKAELRQHVWGGTHVSDTVLRVCVQEIRAALGDAAAAPQYLETVAQQGYRFRVGGATDGPAPTDGGSHRGARSRTSRGWRTGSSAPPTARASSSSSAATSGLARRRWSISFWPTVRPGARGGSGGGSAPSTMARGNRTCRSSRRCGS